MNITLGSLFSGAGGFELAGAYAGIVPLWASEIEPLPIRVTSKRFPELLHLGDIGKVDGGKIPPVDVITFGSPCQDLSTANAGRQGLRGERSGLFMEAVRIIREISDIEGVPNHNAVSESIKQAQGKICSFLKMVGGKDRQKNNY